MADLVQIAPGETDLGKIVAALRAVIERFPAAEDLATASAGALQSANNLSDVASAKTSRVNLNIDKLTSVSDASYSIVATDKVVRLSAITVSRTFTLPALAGVSDGQEFIIIDRSGSLSGSVTLSIALDNPATDSFQAGAPGGTIVLSSPFDGVRLWRTASNRWNYIVQGIESGGTGAASASAARTNLGVAYGLQTIDVWASGMVGYPGATPGQTTYTSGGFSAITFDFDQTTLEAVNFQIAMPKSWDKGSIFFVPYWTATGGSGGVVWNFFAAAISDNEALNATISTTVSSTDTFQNADRLHIAPITGGLTPDGSPANDDMIYFAMNRDPTNGSDTLTADARLIGVKVLYTVNAANDA